MNQLLHLGTSAATSQSAPKGAKDEELETEIVLTQASQVAYHLRQQHRAFDTACLFELLASEFMKRKTCIKPSYDLSKGPTDELDPKIFNVNNKAKMVQLLLALSKEPNPAPPASAFASRFLKAKMKDTSEGGMFVKPSTTDYTQADC